MSEQEQGSDAPRGIRASNVSAWFGEHISGSAPPLEFELIVGGHSNLTYKVTDSKGAHFVLRRPPLGAILKTAHDMAREHRILSGVVQTEVPVPQVLGLCEDEDVNDAPFYVMEYVEGLVAATPDFVRQHIPESERPPLGEHVIEVLAALHNANPDDVGLGTLGKKTDYLARQLYRWQKQWTSAKTRELQLMEDIHQELVRRMPEQIGSAIVHGDYRLGNMLVSSGKVQAVLDWELCTLGDPLADVGYLLNDWTEPGDRAEHTAGGGPSSAGGFPRRQHLVERYGELTGRDASNVDYYRAFQAWRLASIGEGVLARYLKGVMGGEADTDGMRAGVERRAQFASELLEQAP